MIIPEDVKKSVSVALAWLPKQMRSDAALVQLYATGLQESRFVHRKQIGGPAMGFWQFEEGGGVKGVMSHPASKAWAEKICVSRGLNFSRHSIYLALAEDDILAAVFARLLYWTDPKPLPGIPNASAAWDLYLRTWRPGKPHPDTWAECYAAALAAV